MPRTLFDKVWDGHLVRPATADTPAVLYVDLHLVHEVTSPQAFAALRERGLRVRRPDRTVATMDHSTPTTPLAPGERAVIQDAQAAAQVGAPTGHGIEYRGEAARALTMEERMTVCNMSIEAGGRAGMVAPDETTFEYLSGRPFAPKGADWDRAVVAWRALSTDEGARFDK